MSRSSYLGWIVAAVALAATYAPNARACGGGMFYTVGDQETVSVEGHSVVVSISKKRTVLWDRIRYVGAPQDFAWVMPVNPGAKLELASAAWIEAIVGGTAPVVQSPYAECDDGSDESSIEGGCCGSAKDAGLSGGGGESRGEQTDVTVVHQEAVGPYDTVTIKSDVPGAIGTWLTDNGYAIPAAVQPILDDYAGKGMEFLAVRLEPGSGVQDMQPIRVIMDGMLTTFPMRMLSAGAKDKVPITLVVLAEGRYEAKGFTNAVIDGSSLTWNFDQHTSDYGAKRAAALAQNGGATWLTSFAWEGAVAEENNLDVYNEEPPSASLGRLYYERGHENGDTAQTCTDEQWFDFGTSGDEVVELCADTTMPCSQLMPGQIDSKVFACGTLTDLSTALVGMHPSSLWFTRLEAELPVAALANDLTLQPAAQDEVSHFVDAGESTGDPCKAPELDARMRAVAPRGVRLASAPSVLLLGIGLALARRRSRRR